MPRILEDRILETSVTAGAGNFALAGAVTGFRRFSAVCAVNDVVPYFIEAIDAVGLPTGEYEYGFGTYSAANTLTRTRVLGSSNGGALVVFAAGTKNVGLGAHRQEIDYRSRPGFRNKLINGNFKINQRVAAAGATAYAAGAYVMDRWKAGAGGCTCSWAVSGNDVIVTITAGSLMQVVEDLNVEGGVYALSNQGTAQARIAVNGAATGGAYAAATTDAPLVSAAATALQTMTVEFTVGTVHQAQLESGNVATPFERRAFGTELALCQRYYAKSYNQAVAPGTASQPGLQSTVATASGALHNIRFPMPMRAAPTLTVYSPTTGAASNMRDASAGIDISVSVYVAASETGASIINSAGMTTGNIATLQWAASSEL